MGQVEDHFNGGQSGSAEDFLDPCRRKQMRFTASPLEIKPDQIQMETSDPTFYHIFTLYRPFACLISHTFSASQQLFFLTINQSTIISIMHGSVYLNFSQQHFDYSNSGY
jgi:hypothetical protein